MDPAEVELKISVAGADDARTARRALGFERSDATQATIWFCDLPETGADGAPRFELADRGVIVRLRRKRGDDSDSTIKFRRPPPLTLPAGWPSAGGEEFKVEGDWTSNGRSVAASLTSVVDADDIDALDRGPRLAGRLFSGDQERFAADLLVDHPAKLTGLQPLGPIHAWRWKEKERADLGNELGAELWDADGLVFLELSIRVAFADAPRWLDRLTAWAADRDLPTSMGTTKTQTVLEHFARR